MIHKFFLRNYDTQISYRAVVLETNKHKCIRIECKEERIRSVGKLKLNPHEKVYQEQ
jgi:hypothetical protein